MFTNNSMGCGISFVWKGVGDFYTHSYLWKYVWIPLLIVLALYSGVFWYISAYAIPQLQQAISDKLSGSFFQFLESFAHWLVPFLVWGGFLAVAGFGSATLLELIGALFFPKMVREYERKELGIESPKLPLMTDLRNALHACIYSVGTCLILVALSILHFFWPIAGFFIMAFVIGYRYAVVYSSEAAFNRGFQIFQINYIFKKRRMMLYGFGFTTFICFQIPFVALFLAPGFVLGGTRMLHKVCEDVPYTD